MKSYKTLQVNIDEAEGRNQTKIEEVLAQVGQSLPACSQRSKVTGVTLTTERMRNLKCRPN